MPFITFIYKIKNINRVFYGKYICDYISDDNEGLDVEVMPYLFKEINKFQKIGEIKQEAQLGD